VKYIIIISIIIILITTLHCKVDGGEPMALIHWYKDNKELYEGKRYHLMYAKDVAILHCSVVSIWSASGSTTFGAVLPKLSRW